MRLVRLAETDLPEIAFTLDGTARIGRSGDSVLTAILLQESHVRLNEFGDGFRAGFCWMGVCQDCVVDIEGHGRVRACATPLEPGMVVGRT